MKIGDRLTEEAGKASARAFVLDLPEKCLGLQRMPERFALLEGFEAAGLKRRVCGNYLIVYRVRGEAIEIFRVFHGAMEYEKLIATDTRLTQ